MGALFFGAFMVVLFIIAICFIIVSTILIISWQAKKRKGQISKKRWLVIPVILLIFNIFVILIPIGFVCFIRSVNSDKADEIVYAESGEFLYWPMDQYNNPTTNWFEMNGTKYVRFEKEGSYLLPYRLLKDKRSEPVANISYHPLFYSAVDKIMYLVFTGSPNGHSMSTVYPVSNKGGFALFDVGGSAGNGLFCPESQVEAINAFYADISNYDTQNLTCEYNEKTADTIKKDITVEPEVFLELWQILNSGQDTVNVFTLQDYLELDGAVRAVTPVPEYAKRVLLVYSKDKIAYREVYLALFEGRVYIVKALDSYSFDGYPVPDKLNQYLIDTVFIWGDESTYW